MLAEEVISTALTRRTDIAHKRRRDIYSTTYMLSYLYAFRWFTAIVVKQGRAVRAAGMRRLLHTDCESHLVRFGRLEKHANA